MVRDTQHRHSILKLGASEKSLLTSTGQAVLRRPVEWIIPHRLPRFEHAYVDEGGTEIWGPGPYLKVPDVDPSDGSAFIDRVFCPWGYPPRSIRVSYRKFRLNLLAVEVARSEPGIWEWLLRVSVL